MKVWKKPGLDVVAAVDDAEEHRERQVQFEEDDYESDEFPDSGRATMHWHTPRMIEFKKVLNWQRYNDEEKNKEAREEESIEAWHAITGADPETDGAASVNADQLKNILNEFDLKVDLAEIGLDGEKDEQGNVQISFNTFQRFTALTPRVTDGVGEGGTELRRVAGTVQIHPGSPIQGATSHLV